jgi:hypothetical protein
VVGSCKHGDEPAGSGAIELVVIVMLLRNLLPYGIVFDGYLFCCNRWHSNAVEGF